MPRNPSTILLLLLVLLAGCAAGGGGQPLSPTTPPSATATAIIPTATEQRPAPSPTAGAAELDTALPLRVGETAAVGPVALTLRAIENDSRCPTQVSCVWEGAAEALIQVTAAGQGPETTTLTLYGQNRETEESSVQVAGYIVRFTALEPYPAQPQPIPQGDYIATFVVEEARSTAPADEAPRAGDDPQARDRVIRPPSASGLRTARS